MWFTILAGHWRIAVLAALMLIIGGQQLWIHHLAAEIASIRNEEIKAENKQLVENSQKESQWHAAITTGFQNYQSASQKTRSTYESQIAALRAAPERVRERPANESRAVPADTAATDLKACDDRLAAARAAAGGCLDAAQGANECEARLALMWQSWPK